MVERARRKFLHHLSTAVEWQQLLRVAAHNNIVHLVYCEYALCDELQRHQHAGKRNVGLVLGVCDGHTRTFRGEHGNLFPDEYLFWSVLGHIGRTTGLAA